MCSWHCCVYQRRAVTQVRRVWCRRTEHRAGGKISTPEEQEEHHMCPTKWPTSGYSWMFLTKCVRSRLQEVGMRSKSPLMLRNPHAACLGPTKGCWDLQSQPNAVQKQQNWQGHHWCPVLLTDMSRCVRRIRIVGKCYTSFLSTTTSSGPASSAVLRQTSIRLHNGSGWFLLPNWKNWLP